MRVAFWFLFFFKSEPLLVLQMVIWKSVYCKTVCVCVCVCVGISCHSCVPHFTRTLSGWCHSGWLSPSRPWPDLNQSSKKKTTCKSSRARDQGQWKSSGTEPPVCSKVSGLTGVLGLPAWHLASWGHKSRVYGPFGWTNKFYDIHHGWVAIRERKPTS